MRVGEVVGGEWDCFDCDRALFSIRQNIVRVDGRWEIHGTKTHTPRVVPLPDAVLIALRRQRAPQAQQRLTAGSAWAPPDVFDVDRRAWRRPDFVFTRATGKPYLQQGFYKQLRALTASAELMPLATHDLRSAADTLLRMAGVEPAVIRQLAGHKTRDMTELYHPPGLPHGRCCPTTCKAARLSYEPNQTINEERASDKQDQLKGPAPE